MLPDAAASHYAEQRGITADVLGIAADIWGTRPPRDFDAWFDANIGMLMELVTAGQGRAIAGSGDYVADALDELGISGVAPESAVETAALVGVASDGRALDSLMYGAVITSKGQVAEGASTSQAWESGLSSLLTRLQVQVADASRAATSLHIASRRGVGYVRMLNPPSCSRCVVLAGRFYRYNQGFDRHPGCDCRHIPANEDRAGDLRTDPRLYFESRSVAQQDKEFTIAGAQAIRDGADMSQVVNARRGMSTAQVNLAGWIPEGKLSTKSAYGQSIATTDEGVTRLGVAYQAMSMAGYAERSTDVRGRRYFKAKAPRLMPETIYQIAEDRPDALRLLKLYGYMSDGPGSSGTSVATSGTILGKATAKSPLRAGGAKPPIPPVNDHPVPADDDGESLARQLDEDFADWAQNLTRAQRAAIVRWQGADDRFYQRIQKVLREDADDPEALAMIEPVLEAVESGVLVRDVLTWRGIRNTNGLFGLPNSRLGELVGAEVPSPGLLAVSTSRAVPVDEFTRPSFGGGPALLRVRVSAGTPAAWLKLVGSPEMAYQRELLLADGHQMLIREVSYTGAIPIVDVEVI